MLLKINKISLPGLTDVMQFIKKDSQSGYVSISLIYSDFCLNRDDEFSLSCPAFVRALDNYRIERIPESYSLRGYVMNNVLSKDVILTTSRGAVSDVISYIDSSLPRIESICRTVVLPNNALMLHTEIKLHDTRIETKDGNFPV